MSGYVVRRREWHRMIEVDEGLGLIDERHPHEHFHSAVKPLHRIACTPALDLVPQFRQQKNIYFAYTTPFYSRGLKQGLHDATSLHSLI